MGQTMQAKALSLFDGRILNGTIIVEQNFVIYVSPTSGKYQEIFPWSSIKSILL